MKEFVPMADLSVKSTRTVYTALAVQIMRWMIGKTFCFFKKKILYCRIFVHSRYSMIKFITYNTFLPLSAKKIYVVLSIYREKTQQGMYCI